MDGRESPPMSTGSIACLNPSPVRSNENSSEREVEMVSSAFSREDIKLSRPTFAANKQESAIQPRAIKSNMHHVPHIA